MEERRAGQIEENLISLVLILVPCIDTERNELRVSLVAPRYVSSRRRVQRGFGLVKKRYFFLLSYSFVSYAFSNVNIYLKLSLLAYPVSGQISRIIGTTTSRNLLLNCILCLSVRAHVWGGLTHFKYIQVGAQSSRKGEHDVMVTSSGNGKLMHIRNPRFISVFTCSNLL